METYQLTHNPVVKAEMLIRKQLPKYMKHLSTLLLPGFKRNGDEIVDQVIGGTEGFALVLSGLKAFLEHNIILNLVSDRFPDQKIQ
ncbi:SRPBCC family protein [Anaeropeptidivorans aminofermentans]|jgi:hypothetical protein|uniref:hypothetical protein n=1 Tax=Anaeropeptidivorans aminofermentans TaxID=2934315 RepID=UPI002024D92B|nr:hypothetical protein [Anaeropeptidivorans aminofermentans]MBE6011584.1 hypothetical protein [Lachnospiraceae bacterium]